MDKGLDSRLDQAWWALRNGLGIAPFQPLDQLARLHQSAILKILPFSGKTFMHIGGVIEMIVGLRF